MSSPIDRIENVRVSVDDVERQMAACQAAGVMFPPNLAWRLLSECRSLLSEANYWRIRYDQQSDNVLTSTTRASSAEDSSALLHEDIAAALNAVRYPDKNPTITYATVIRILEAAGTGERL
jgi:hypothetical protein